MKPVSLILASGSPRRSELLSQMGVVYLCDPADIDETAIATESPQEYVQRMASTKAAVVAARHALSDSVVLAADTSVVIDDDVLGKPVDQMDGLAILARLSGRKHTVMTAVCLHGADEQVTQLVTTEVEFIQLTREICEAYLATSEPWDKAGAYGIQGLGGALVKSINGSYSNVVGLPLFETWQMLSAVGITTSLERSDG